MEENHIACMFPKKVVFYASPVMSCLDFSFTDCFEICSSKGKAYQKCVVIPEEISQTPILPSEMLNWQQLGSSEWEQLDVTACWLPEEALPFQENGSGCGMLN